MIVNVEFLDEEPLDNLITAMRYKVGKVIYFGAEELIDQQQEFTQNFLKNRCGVSEVEFKELSDTDINSAYEVMYAELRKEIDAGNAVYFDITGGKDMHLMVFGMLAKEFGCSVHEYKVAENCLIEVNEAKLLNLSDFATPQEINMTLDEFLLSRGCRISDEKNKEFKQNMTPEFEAQVMKIADVAREYAEYWNPFSDLLKVCFKIPKDGNCLVTQHDTADLLNRLSDSKNELKSIKVLKNILYALEGADIIRGFRWSDRDFRFAYASREMKYCLHEGGSFLEIYAMLKERSAGNESIAGVALDWDLEDGGYMDVNNEVDTVAMHGTIPVFISCKSGNMDTKTAPPAMYQLQTVAQRCGGKYAKMQLMILQDMAPVFLERAKEMGIEVVRV